MHINKVFVVGLGLFLSGCATTTVGSDKDIMVCVERSEMCTQEYVPVCGQNKDGDWQTYGNACTACSNLSVVGYKDGACE